FFASAGVAAVLFAATIEFQGFGEQIFEGITMLVAVAVLSSMVLWMMNAARSIKAHVQERIEAVLKQSAVFGLTLLSFVVVFREGVETALFMFGAGALTSPFEAVLGVGLGLLIAGIIGFGIVRVSWRLNLRRFFQITGIFLVVVAAGLFANAIHELQEAFAWQLGSAAVLWRDLEGLRPAGGLARHAIDAIRLADHVGLVTTVLLPLGAALLDDLVVPAPLFAGGEEPFKHVDRADVHADAVRDTSVKIDGHVGAVDAEPGRIGGAVRIGSLFAFGEDLVVEVNSRLRILVRFVHEVRVDRFRFEVHFSRHRVASKELGPALIRAGHRLVYPSP